MFRTHLRKTALGLISIVALILLVAACGAAPTPAPTPTPIPAPTATTAPSTAQTVDTVSFSKHILPLFQKNCTRCHSGANPPTGLNLESYEAVMKGNSSGPVIGFWGNGSGVPGRSLLYQVLTTGAMPKGAEKLAAEDMQTIAAWIFVGAPNN